MQGAKLRQQIGLILRNDFNALSSVKQLLDESMTQPLILLDDEDQMWTQIQQSIDLINKKTQRKLKQLEERAAKIAQQVVEEEVIEEPQEDEENQIDEEIEDENPQENDEPQEYDEEEGNFRFEKKNNQKDDFAEFEKYMQDYDDGKLGKIDLDQDDDEDDEEDEDNEEEDNEQVENEGEDSVFEEMREEQIENENNENNDDEIKQLEDKRLQKKDWQFGGEVQGRQRPLNSLIEQDLDFDVNRKMLEETTNPEQQNKLIELIKKRIQDELYDDRQKVVVDLNALDKPKDQVDTNKSQFGLAELYERQFKQALGLPTNTSEQKLKQELFEDFRNLNYKLDQLTNLSFEPRGYVKQGEIKVLDNNIIQREEKVPLTLRGEQIENVEKMKKNGFETKEEKDHESNKKNRRMSKQRKRNRERESKRKGLIKKLDNRGETKFMYNQHQQGKKQMSFIKEQKNKESVKFDKSSTFFKNLQESRSVKKNIKK